MMWAIGLYVLCFARLVFTGVSEIYIFNIYIMSIYTYLQSSQSESVTSTSVEQKDRQVVLWPLDRLQDDNMTVKTKKYI